MLAMMQLPNFTGCRFVLTTSSAGVRGANMVLNQPVAHKLPHGCTQHVVDKLHQLQNNCQNWQLMHSHNAPEFGFLIFEVVILLDTAVSKPNRRHLCNNRTRFRRNQSVPLQSSCKD
uniref:Uncharacterized protein n=1 Tax=Grammatophora oceanica TaxID=210454 RepID=A0A7S1VS49_9STRA